MYEQYKKKILPDVRREGLMVPMAGIEPARYNVAISFQDIASTSFTT